MKFIFADQNDIHNTWGLIKFDATPLQKLSEADPLDFTIRCAAESADGSYILYGDRVDKEGNQNIFRLVRVRTADGVTYSAPEMVLECAQAPWMHWCTITRNGDTGELLCLKSRSVPGDGGGFGIYAFKSEDGDKWRECDGNPLFLDGDSYGSLWSPALHKYVFFGKVVERWEKNYADNVPGARRCLTLRTSEDGVLWVPDDSQVMAYGVRAGGPFIPVEHLIRPDELDPPELEFYRGIGFSHEGRCYMMVLNYAPIPEAVNRWGGASPQMTSTISDTATTKRGRHGPHMGTEWWISRDGITWKRPFRNTLAVNDPGEANDLNLITHNPLRLGGKLLFIHKNGTLWGIPEDRITYLTSPANAVFTTVLFKAPGRPFSLNAMIPSPDFPNNSLQAYVMAELIDERDSVIAGYEKEKCILQDPVDSTSLPLRWEGKDAADLKDTKIRIRFYTRISRIYAVTC